MGIDNHDVAVYHRSLVPVGRVSLPLEEVQLPQRIDQVAFAEIYREMGPRLWSYIRKVSGDGTLADDILQETFYRFLRADLPAPENFQAKAYIYRIANSLLSDHWRQLKRERRWTLAGIFGREAGKSTETAGDTKRVFEQLKAQEQSLLWLAYVEGFDHREIALALHLKEKSVRVLLFRARRKLAEMLDKENLGPEEGR